MAESVLSSKAKQTEVNILSYKFTSVRKKKQTLFLTSGFEFSYSCHYTYLHLLQTVHCLHDKCFLHALLPDFGLHKPNGCSQSTSFPAPGKLLDDSTWPPQRGYCNTEDFPPPSLVSDAWGSCFYIWASRSLKDAGKENSLWMYKGKKGSQLAPVWIYPDDPWVNSHSPPPTALPPFCKSPTCPHSMSVL